MLNYMYIINLFIVPLVAVYLNTYYLSGTENKFTEKTFVEYGVFIAGNIPLTRIIIKLVDFVVNKNINLDSALYTLVAVISAIILAIVFNVFKKCVEIKVEVEKISK